MTLRVVIDQYVANQVMKRDGIEGFDRWWEALGVLVRLTWPNDPQPAGKRPESAPPEQRAQGGGEVSESAAD